MLPFGLTGHPFRLKVLPDKLTGLPFGLKALPFEMKGIPFGAAGLPFELKVHQFELIERPRAQHGCCATTSIESYAVSKTPSAPMRPHKANLIE